MKDLHHSFLRQSYQELPLKIIVTSKYIGAIIGQGGLTIRNISRETKSHIMVDVNNPTYDENGNAEKLVWITGTVENCSNACEKILNIIQKEKSNVSNKMNYVELKIRVPNQLIGRLIGKKGYTIKKIMEESGALISTNDSRSLFDYSLFPAYIDSNSFERVITIHGTTTVIVCAAEYKVSQKLRDFQNADLIYQKCKSTLPFLNPNLSSNLQNYNNVNFSSPMPNTLNPSMCYSFIDYNRYAHNLAFKSSFVPIKCRIYIPNHCATFFTAKNNSFINKIVRMTGAKILVKNNLTKEKLLSNESLNIKKPSVDKSLEETKVENHIKNQAEKIPIDNKRTLINEVGDAKEEASKCLKVECQTEDINLFEEHSSDNEDEGSYLTLDSPLFLEEINNKAKLVNSSSISKEKNLTCQNESKISVYISGYDIQVYKAEYYIFQKIAELNHCYNDEIRLSSEIIVPPKILGRIIGKKGRNIYKLQSITNAVIKISDEDQNKYDSESKQDVLISVLSTYASLKIIQIHYCSLIADLENKKGQNTSKSASI